MNWQLDLPISSDVSISLNMACCTEKTVTLLHPVTVFFKESQQVDRILAKREGDAIQDFHGVLENALSGKFPLPPILENPGYGFNEWLQGRTKEGTMELLEGRPHWSGHKFSPWCTPGNVKPEISTWLYDKDGKIIFELTPIYPWEDDDNDNEDFISYEEWIKDYKPLFVAEISRSIALEWLKKTEELIETMKANNKHLKEFNELCDCKNEE